MLKNLGIGLLFILACSSIWLWLPLAYASPDYYTMISADKTGTFTFSIALENNETIKVTADIEDMNGLKVFTSLTLQGANSQNYYIVTNFVYRPDKVLPYALVSTVKPKFLLPNINSHTLTVTATNGQTLTLYWMVTTNDPVGLVQQTPQPFDIIGGIQAAYNFFANIGGFTRLVISMFTRLPEMFVQGLNFIGRLIGKTGDPALIADVSLYKTQLTALTTNPNCGYLAQQALNGSTPLGNVAHLINVKPEHHDKTLPDLENAMPTGFLGFLCTAWAVLTSPFVLNIVVMIVKNFVLINVVIICVLVTFGMAESIRKKSIDPVLTSLERVKDYFLMYYKFASWLFETAYRILQLAVNVLSAILPW